MKMRLFIVLLYGVFEFIQPALAVVDFNTLYPRLLNMSDPREDPQFINAFERDSGKTAERFLESVTPEKLVSLPEPILKRLIQLSNFNHNQFFLFDRSTLTEEERHKWLSTLLGADLHKQRTAAIKQEKRIWLFRNKKSYDKNLALITEALNFISVNPEIISSSLNEELAATVNFILLNAPRHLKYGFATEILRNLLLSYTRLLNKFARSNTSETLLSEHVDNLKILFMSFSNSYSHWTMQLPFKVKQELAELRAVTFVDELVDKSNISVFDNRQAAFQALEESLAEMLEKRNLVKAVPKQPKKIEVKVHEFPIAAEISKDKISILMPPKYFDQLSLNGRDRWSYIKLFLPEGTWMSIRGIAPDRWDLISPDRILPATLLNETIDFADGPGPLGKTIPYEKLPDNCKAIIAKINR